MFGRISKKVSRVYGVLLSFFEKFYWVFFAAAVLVLAFYCFRCLDVQYVDSWDEARHGVNAYEMMQNENYIVHTYNYETDYWNLKPSISYWAVMLGFAIFGYSVTGLRFVSALSYLLTGVIGSLFAKRRYTKEASILVLLFFCANERPLSAHLARAGDADALFMLFFTIAVISALLIRENHRYLYVLGVSFSLAFLTKSWHSFMIAAVAGLYLLISKELFRQTLKRWLLFLASVFAPLLAWFGWRFTKDGLYFLSQMLEVDLLARTTTSGYEGHSYPFSFYWEYVFGHEEFIYRWLILICIAAAVIALAVMVRKKSLRENKTAIMDAAGLFIWFAVPFLGFSLIETKLIWYCYPCTVPLIIGAAAVIGRILVIPLKSCRAVQYTDAQAAGPDGSADSCIEDHFKIVEGGVALADRKTPRSCPDMAVWPVLAAAVLAAAMTVSFMWNCYVDVIRGAHGDAFQLFIAESVDRDSEYAGLTAYVYVAGEDAADIGAWDQNMLFVAEISGDFHCEDGGVEAFLGAEDEALLYISAAEYGYFAEELSEMEVLYENGSYFLIGNF